MRYQLSLLRWFACELLNVLTREASGRQGVLEHPGPNRLLAALATCLSDALGLRRLKTASGAAAGSSFTTQTVAAVTRVLENLTKSEPFLVSPFGVLRNGFYFHAFLYAVCTPTNKNPGR